MDAPTELRPARTRAYNVQRGSAGRILLVLRDNHAAAADADTDQATALRDRLCAEGFEAVIESASACDAAAYDLVHAIGLWDPAALRDPLRRARAAGKTIVLSPTALRTGEVTWGSALVLQVLRVSHDTVTLDDHLRMLAQRKLEMPEIAVNQEPFNGYTEALREILGTAGALLVADGAEEQLLRSLGADAPVLHVPDHAIEMERAVPMEAVLGTGDFILCHAPIEPRCNQFTLVLAAQSLGLPLVLAGPVADLEYVGFLRAYAGDSVLFQAEPDPSERAAMYRSARVFADVAWTRMGTGRIRAAQDAGCSLAVAGGGADPASVASIAAALSAAWDGVQAPPRPAQEDPLVATVRAYAQASKQTPVSP